MAPSPLLLVCVFGEDVEELRLGLTWSTRLRATLAVFLASLRIRSSASPFASGGDDFRIVVEGL
jgi:hypothetical protein